ASFPADGFETRFSASRSMMVSTSRSPSKVDLSTGSRNRPDGLKRNKTADDAAPAFQRPLGHGGASAIPGRALPPASSTPNSAQTSAPDNLQSDSTLPAPRPFLCIITS